MIDQTTNFLSQETTDSIAEFEDQLFVEDASAFPDPADGETRIVVFDGQTFRTPADDPDVEVMAVTARDTNASVLTVARGRESTSATVHPTGARVIAPATAGLFGQIDSTLEALDTAVASKADDPHALGGDVHSASTRAAVNALVSDATLESEQGAQARVDSHTATEVHDEPQPPAGKGEANGVAELDDTGVLRSGQVPALAISETFTITNESDLTALDATIGDVGVVTSDEQSYICTGDPSSLDNWSEIQTPAPPVQDVFGRTGSINPQSGDYSASQISNFTSSAADAAPVQSVNNKQGTVSLDAADVSAEPDGAVKTHRTSETHTTAQPPESHALDGSVHSATTRAGLNGLVSDATLESESGAQAKADTAESNAESYADMEIENHRTGETHTNAQPPEQHDNAAHSTNFVEEGSAVSYGSLADNTLTVQYETFGSEKIYLPTGAISQVSFTNNGFSTATPSVTFSNGFNTTTVTSSQSLGEGDSASTSLDSSDDEITAAVALLDVDDSTVEFEFEINVVSLSV